MKFLNSFIKLNKMLAILVATTCIQFSYAQKELKFSAGVASSYVQLNTDNSAIKNDVVAGFGALLGVSYALKPQFSLHGGVAVNLYRSENELGTYNGIQNTTDISGDAFEFRYQVTNFSETQKITAISIPITVQYETKGDFRFYARTGLEVNFFVNENYESSAENITTTGFFPDLNAVLDRPTFAGFGSFNDKEFTESNVALNTSYNALLELGIKKLLKNGTALYAGVFAKIGLNNITPTAKTNGILSYNRDAPTDFLTTSILEAVEIEASFKKAFTEAKLNVFGFNIRYEFSL